VFACLLRASLCLSVALAAGACGKGTGTCGSEFVAGEGDFGCVVRWSAAKNIHFAHRCGPEIDVRQQLENPQVGMRFPVGTILQATPHEAMVKRGGGFDPDHGDWEYFVLGVGPSGTRILQRGTDGPFNPAGRCTGCHHRADDHDNVCGMAHQCPPPGIHNAAFLPSLYLDPRCLAN
jgi:hypothetical protein